MALVGEQPVGANFAVESSRYCNLFGPADLDRTRLRHRVNGREVDGVGCNVCNLVRLLAELELIDLCCELVHDAGGVLRVGSNLVEVLVDDDDVLEAGRRFGADRVPDVFDTPLECTGALLQF